MVQVDASAADFTSARLDDADLIQANLQGTILCRATLLDAKMGAADLCVADIIDADFRGATGLKLLD